MKPRAHAISSVILAALLFLFFRQWSIALITFCTGVFVDLDHLVDFWLGKPKNFFSIKEFFNPHSYMKRKNRVLVFFHGYEYVIVLCLMSWGFRWSAIFLALASGLLVHLILDDYGNKLKTLSYFITYRVAKNFRVFRDN